MDAKSMRQSRLQNSLGGGCHLALHLDDRNDCFVNQILIFSLLCIRSDDPTLAMFYLICTIINNHVRAKHVSHVRTCVGSAIINPVEPGRLGQWDHSSQLRPDGSLVRLCFELQDAAAGTPGRKLSIIVYMLSKHIGIFSWKWLSIKQGIKWFSGRLIGCYWTCCPLASYMPSCSSDWSGQGHV